MQADAEMLAGFVFAAAISEQADAAIRAESAFGLCLNNAKPTVHRKFLRDRCRQHHVNTKALGFVVGVDVADEWCRDAGAGVVLPQVGIKTFHRDDR